MARRILETTYEYEMDGVVYSIQRKTRTMKESRDQAVPEVEEGDSLAMFDLAIGEIDKAMVDDVAVEPEELPDLVVSEFVIDLAEANKNLVTRLKDTVA